MKPSKAADLEPQDGSLPKTIVSCHSNRFLVPPRTLRQTRRSAHEEGQIEDAWHVDHGQIACVSCFEEHVNQHLNQNFEHNLIDIRFWEAMVKDGHDRMTDPPFGRLLCDLGQQVHHQRRDAFITLLKRN